MRQRIPCTLFLLLLLLVSGISQALMTPRKAILLDINGPIGPATQDYVHRGIEHAINENAELIILNLDTPGGLDKAMRDIIKDIINSPLPIVAYVTPAGARAASAGTYILYASHIAAMAPATNLGAATPVFIESPFATFSEKPSKEMAAHTPLETKIVNDAAAYIKGLAGLRGRNIAWAEKAVREGGSLPADEAVKLHIVDFIAQDIPELLKKLNGHVVTLQQQKKALHTQDLVVEHWGKDWRVRFLEMITDPSIAYFLLLLGIFGLFFELSNPGFVLPGVMGIISLLLAFYALQMLPVNYAGLGLLLAGLIFMTSELYITSYGVLGVGGVIAFVLGSILLFDMDGYAIPWKLIFGMSLFFIGFFFMMIRLVLKSRQQRVVSGVKSLIGRIAVVIEDFDGIGWVKIGGETWKSRSAVPLKKGQKVKIIQITGLEFLVEPLNKHGD